MRTGGLALGAANDNLDRLFGALADPTRRAVLVRLGSGPERVGALAEPFDMALPSFMEHIGKLEDGGLIETRKQGRARYCALRPGALDPMQAWMDEQRSQWNARFDRLETYVETLLREGEDVRN